MAKHRIRIRTVRRQPVNLDRLAVALLALARQIADEDASAKNELDVSPGDADDEGVQQ